MGVPSLEVGYTSATTGRGDHEVHKGHVVALEKKLWIKILRFEDSILLGLDAVLMGSRVPTFRPYL
jgi:hypothetical protein